MRTIPTFSDFKAGPGGHMAGRLGVQIDQCETWQDFGVACRHANRGAKFTDKAVKMGGVLSSGEVSVLCALLHAADYSSVADSIASDGTWYRLSRTIGPHGEAVLACIAMVDG